MPLIDIATGATLQYEEAGSGAPVIAIHGRLGRPNEDFARIFDWLSPKYRVLAPWLRGYGQSLPKPRDFPLKFYHRDADDLLAFMDALNIDKAHLLGYSDGGEVGLICAGLQPERFVSVAVWGAVGYFGPAIRPIVQANYPPTWISAEDQRIHGIADPDAFALGWINAMKHYIDSGGNVSLSLAPNMTCPLLLMLGDQDRLNPEAFARCLVDKTRHGRLEMFPCGHAVHDEQWESFRRIVGSFMADAERLG